MYPRRFQLSRTPLIFKQYLLNVAAITKIIGEQDSEKNVRQGYYMLPWQPHFRAMFTQILSFLH